MNPTNPHAATFVLRQHTPIIHFQRDQPAATIRPTEFRSKLDRFLIYKLCDNAGTAEERLAAVQASDYRHWLQHAAEPKHPAFNWQVDIRIVSGDAHKEPIERRDNRGREQGFPGFFANMGDNQHERKVFRFHRLVMVQLQSRHADLIEKITELMPEFLLWTNFGTRQSKGFGSYYLHLKDPNYQEPILNYSFELEVAGDNDLTKQKNLFNALNLFYKSLRSGINESYSGKGMYFKSLMWRYAKDEQWDKKTIKQHFFENEEDIQKNNHRPDSGAPKWKKRQFDEDSPLFWENGVDDSHLWRDLLGLSTQQEWKSYNDTLTKTHRPADGESEITRFASPLHFKPIRIGRNKFKVFFGVYPAIQRGFAHPADFSIPEAEILGASFAINFEKSKEESLPLAFPASFDYADFLRTSLRTNLNQYVRKKGSREREYGGLHHDGNENFLQLQHIYKQLNQQING